jgi:hypothetical protein
LVPSLSAEDDPTKQNPKFVGMLNFLYSNYRHNTPSLID